MLILGFKLGKSFALCRERFWVFKTYIYPWACNATHRLGNLPHKTAVFSSKSHTNPMNIRLQLVEEGTTCTCALRSNKVSGFKIFDIYFYLLNIKTLTPYNFTAPWGIWIRAAVFEASNL